METNDKITKQKFNSNIPFFVDEPQYEQVKPAKLKSDKTPVRFFRMNESINDLIEESKIPFNKAIDQSLITDGADYDFELDEQEDCAESCEPF